LERKAKEDLAVAEGRINELYASNKDAAVHSANESEKLSAALVANLASKEDLQNLRLEVRSSLERDELERQAKERGRNLSMENFEAEALAKFATKEALIEEANRANIFAETALKAYAEADRKKTTEMIASELSSAQAQLVEDVQEKLEERFVTRTDFTSEIDKIQLKATTQLEIYGKNDRKKTEETIAAHLAEERTHVVEATLAQLRAKCVQREEINDLRDEIEASTDAKIMKYAKAELASEAQRVQSMIDSSESRTLDKVAEEFTLNCPSRTEISDEIGAKVSAAKDDILGVMELNYATKQDLVVLEKKKG